MALALVAGLATAACGRAESATDDDSRRFIPAAEADDLVEVVERADAPDPPLPAAPDGVEDRAGSNPSSAEAPEAPTRTPATVSAPEPAASPDRPRIRPAVRPARPAEPSPAGEIAAEAGGGGEVEPPAAPPVRELLGAPAGTRFEARLVRALSTSDNQAGDPVSAHLVDDVLGVRGEVLLPRGARLAGRVLESRESADSEQPAVLRLVFDRIEVNGRMRPLVATVVDAEVETAARDSGGRTAAKVGAGAAAGAVLGRILGNDTKDAVRGAIAGAAAGTAVAMATRSGHASMEEGARIVLRLDERLIVEER